MSDTTVPAPSEADIAYLKRLAQAGRGEPAPFLLLMAVFGGGYGLFGLVLCLTVFIEFTTGDRMPAPGGLTQSVAAWSFGLTTLAFIAAVGWTLWRTFGPRPIPVSRSATAIWSGAFLGLVAVFGSVVASASAPFPIFTADALGSALLILWGCAWWATAIASDRRWLLAVGVGSFLAAVLLPIATPNFWAGPLLTACLLLLAFLPAVLLMRARKR